MKNKLALTLLFSITSGFATEIAVFGGGGDPSGPTTIFDGALKNLATANANLKMPMSLAFNGGHATTEQIVSTNLHQPNRPFTLENYNSIIADYIAKINNGQIKAGDQLLITVDTHGAEKDTTFNNAELTHQIAINGSVLDPNSSSLSGPNATLDNLKTLADLAIAKNIKLGIVDFRCHSGNSIILGNQNTCVISASGPNHYGYGTFAENFYSNMKKGNSLEEVYLQARKDMPYPSFPMISSDAGLKMNAELYSLLSPYMDYIDRDAHADKLSYYAEHIVLEGKECQRDNDFLILEEKLKKLMQQAGDAFYKQSISDLIVELKKYKNFQDGYIKDLEKLNLTLLSTKESFYPKTSRFYRDPKDKKGILRKVQPEAQVHTWRDIITFPEDNLSYFQDSLKNATNKVEREDAQDFLDVMTQVIAKKHELLAAHPEFQNVNHVADSYAAKSQEMWTSVTNISRLANVVYDNGYRKMMNNNSSVKNPCAEFKF